MSALLALIQAKKQDLASQRKGSVERLGEGTTTLRIMGGWAGADTKFWHDFGKHFVKNAEGKLAESYICTKRTFGRPCAICDAIANAKSQNLPESIAKLVGDSSAGGRTLVNAINPQHPKEPHKVHIYELPAAVFAQIIETAEQYMGMGVELIGPAGRDLYITRTGKGIQTKYTVTPAPVSTPIPDVKEQDINDLEKFTEQESSEQRTRTLAALNNLIGSDGALPTAGITGGIPAGLLGGGIPAGLLGGSPTAAPIDPVAAAKAAQAAMLQQQAAAQAAAAQQAAAVQAAAQQAAQQAAAVQAAAQQAAQQAAAAQATHMASVAAAEQAAVQFADVPDLTPIAAPDLSGLSGSDIDLDDLLKNLGA